MDSEKTQEDPEKHPQRPEFVPGLDELAAFVSTDTERSIYPRFRDLGALNIIYKANDLARVQKYIDECDRKEQDILADKAHPRRALTLSCSASISALQEAAKSDEYYKLKLEALENLHNMLNDYRQAIYMEGAMNSVQVPPKRCFRLFKTFLEKKDGCMVGLGEHMEECDRENFLTLDPAGPPDRLTVWVENIIARFKLKRFKQDMPKSWGDMYDTSNAKTAGIVNGINAILGVSLTAAAVVTLEKVQVHLKPYLFSVFSLCYAGYSFYMTGATRAETLGTIAAFASVLIVYMVAPAANSGGKV